MSDMSDRILNLIQDARVSYSELSELTSIPKSALQRYATGGTDKIPIDRVAAIANALSTTPMYILGWNSPEIKKELVTPTRDDERSKQNLDLFMALSPDQQEEVKKYMRYIASLKEEEGK